MYIDSIRPVSHAELFDFDPLPDIWRILDARIDLAAALSADATLSGEDQMAVTVGRHDADRYGWRAFPPRSRRMRKLLSLIRAVTGWSEPLPLSNARLEALRLVACLARRGDPRLGEVVERLAGLGVSPATLDAVIAGASR